MYLIDWWLYSNNDPEPDLIHTINTQKFVNNSELYLQTVNAIKIIVYDILTRIISENTSRDEFNKASEIIALPNDKKDNFYFYSDKYSNRWKMFISVTDWGLLKTKAELQQTVTELKALDIRTAEQEEELKRLEEEIKNLQNK